MDIDACIKKIDRYLLKDNVQPLVVDVQNRADLSELVTHYNVSGNVFAAASQYCNVDEYPQIDELGNDISSKTERLFVTGLSAFLKLQGEKMLRETLREILGMSSAGHVVVITYQCRQYLDCSDPRLERRIVFVDGMADEKQRLVFLSPELTLPRDATEISGIHCIGDAVEHNASTKLYVKTKKQKSNYPDSIFQITEFNNAYDILIQHDSATASLREEYGTREQWNYALDKFGDKKNWVDLIDSEFGNHRMLDIVFHQFKNFEPNRQWLYFIALKLFGAKNNWCLNEAAAKSSDLKELPKQIYRSLLNVSKDSRNFEDDYHLRKKLLADLGNPEDEVLDYCHFVRGMRKDAVYYLTDNTPKEKELIFELLDRYADEYTKEEVYSALKLVYPAIYQYLSAYRFKNDFLDSYFQSYKYQKVINRVLPEFDKIVTEQASKRDYNLMLEPRSAKIEAIDRTDAQLYFVDAMGVEYLSYIMSVCSELHLMANVTVCRCELPSITSKNKEFLDLFKESPLKTISVKDIDDIKHHGKDNFDYQRTKLPIHLIRELEILHELLKRIKGRLADDQDTLKKAVLIADHGASRLAVIHETECIWEMAEKGEHSGRCCLKTDVDRQPPYAADAGEFWALANYDRFKGGRKADVEVHGGATLEEVTVPIIELTYLPDVIEVRLLPIDADSILLDGIPEISVSYRKKAAIKIFATAKLQNACIGIDGKFYDAVPVEDGFYVAEMPDIKRAKTYSVAVYAGENCIAEGLPLRVKKEGSSERELL